MQDRDHQAETREVGLIRRDSAAEAPVVPEVVSRSWWLSGVAGLTLAVGSALAGRASLGPEPVSQAVVPSLAAARVASSSAGRPASPSSLPARGVSRVPGVSEAEQVKAFGRRLVGRPSYPYAALIRRIADEQGLPEGLVAGVIKVESDFDPRCVSPVGAMGLMQLMPATARGIRHKVGIRRLDLFDPEQNIRLGTFFLKALLKEFGHDLPTALSYYNAGRRGIISRGRFRNGRYIRAVMGSYARYGRGSRGPRPDGQPTGLATSNSSAR